MGAELSSLYREIHYIKVRYIKVWVYITRKIFETIFFYYTDFRQPVLNFTLQPITHLGNDVTDTFLSQIYAWRICTEKNWYNNSSKQRGGNIPVLLVY